MSHDSWVPVFLLTVLTVLGVPLLIVPLVLLLWRLVFCRRRDAALSDRIASRTHAVLTTETSSARGPTMETIHIAGEDVKQPESVSSAGNGLASATNSWPRTRDSELGRRVRWASVMVCGSVAKPRLEYWSWLTNRMMDGGRTAHVVLEGRHSHQRVNRVPRTLTARLEGLSTLSHPLLSAREHSHDANPGVGHRSRRRARSHAARRRK